MGIQFPRSLGGERRSLGELAEQVYLDRGDVAGKQSRFWILLGSAAIIATAGVIADSTAVVVGSMIIAPVSIPILGIAVGITEGSARQALRSLGFTVLTVLFVVGVAALLSTFLPLSMSLAENPQVSARTSPGLIDLLTAVAAGIAGAFGTARKDVGDILPGVAIALSLAPPLAIVGITAAHGEGSLALGALLLFVTNLVALVAAGTLVFAAYGYASEARLVASRTDDGRRPRRPAHALLALSVLIVTVPLAADTVYEAVLTRRLDRTRTIAAAWARTAPGTLLKDVTREGTTYIVTIEGPDTGPSPHILLRQLSGAIPSGTPIIVDHIHGSRFDIGNVP